ncbi:MAG: hypothetical protein AAFY71_11455 [Bacteroidota bacterium]
MKYLLSIITIMGTLWSYGQDELLRQANEAYTQNQYEYAVSLYDSLISEGYQSEQLFYNAGNAHYRLKHIGSAILNYERTLKLNPAHENAAHNLELARLRTLDKLEEQPELFVSKWLKDTYRSQNADQWGNGSVILIWLALIFGGIFLFVQVPLVKQISFFGGVIALVLSLATLGLSLSRLSDQSNSKEGIVMTPAAYVKAAPNGQTDLLILHEGSKVKILDEVDGWRKIRISAISTGTVEGFVRSEQVKKI